VEQPSKEQTKPYVSFRFSFFVNVRISMKWSRISIFRQLSTNRKARVVFFCGKKFVDLSYNIRCDSAGAFEFRSRLKTRPKKLCGTRCAAAVWVLKPKVRSLCRQVPATKEINCALIGHQITSLNLN
jgi:hypothetical protein